METMLVITACVLAASGVAAWHHWFSKRGRLRRALKKAPRLKIAQVKDGQLAKIVGRLRYLEAEPLWAPLTGRGCAYYEVTVEQEKSNNRSSHWETIISDSDYHTTFLIEDDSGRAVVELDLPSVLLTMDAHFSSGVLLDPSPTLKDYLAEHGESGEGWIFNKSLRYKEGVLEQGELVAVRGRCTWEHDPDPDAVTGGYREMPRRLRISLPQEADLLVSDDPRTLR